MADKLVVIDVVGGEELLFSQNYVCPDCGISIEELTHYNCKRYGKSDFYQFDLFIEDQHTLVTTRYKDDFEKILTEHLSAK